MGIVTILLIGAIGFGVYIWYTVQTLNTNAQDADRAQVGTNGDTSTTKSSSGGGESITITKDSLTPTQQKIVESLGYTQDSFTITPEMITCAEEAVGETRYGEIINGGAPTPLESLKLLPCFKK